tara:strand:- start:382 stop:1509 length:1128 start_codon:yes stop_codon:yes gene_type:complete
MSFLKYILFTFVTLLFFSCNSPSEPEGTIIKNSSIYEIDTYCYDVDVNDNTIVVAASDGGYYKFSYTLDGNGFPIVQEVISEDNHIPDHENDSIDRVIMSSGYYDIIYMLDKFTGGYSDVWFDNAEGLSMDPPFFNDNCYQSKYLDIAVDESSSNGTEFDTHRIYSLMKHTSLNENNDDDEFEAYSASLVKREINIVPGINTDIMLVNGQCEYLHNLSYSSTEIHLGDGKLAVASESDGITLFSRQNNGDLDSLFSYNVSGGQAQSVYAFENAVVGGFSNDKGCYMALLESDSDSVSNYIAFAEGHSINGIDFSNNIIGLATGNDGVQLYEWSGGGNVTPYGSINTDEYAYDLKIKGDLIFVATRTGLEIFKIGI